MGRTALVWFVVALSARSWVWAIPHMIRNDQRDEVSIHHIKCTQKGVTYFSLLTSYFLKILIEVGIGIDCLFKHFHNSSSLPEETLSCLNKQTHNTSPGLWITSIHHIH